jgi:hypothetical protein
MEGRENRQFIFL